MKQELYYFCPKCRTYGNIRAVLLEYGADDIVVSKRSDESGLTSGNIDSEYDFVGSDYERETGWYGFSCCRCMEPIVDPVTGFEIVTEKEMKEYMAKYGIPRDPQAPVTDPAYELVHGDIIQLPDNEVGLITGCCSKSSGQLVYRNLGGVRYDRNCGPIMSKATESLFLEALLASLDYETLSKKYGKPLSYREYERSILQLRKIFLLPDEPKKEVSNG